MSLLFGWQSFSAANLHYGRLGKRIMGVIGIHSHISLDSLVKMRDSDIGVLWILRPQVAEALEHLQIVNSQLRRASEEEGILTENFIEGGTIRIEVNVYERSHHARQKCIEIHGNSCVICNFNFDTTYGGVAEGFIHVHHLIPLAQVNTKYVCNPQSDLLPVCANCHAVIHMRNPPFSTEEVKALLKVSTS
jgi:5-methylcytosine-specific restriction enzyme A